MLSGDLMTLLLLLQFGSIIDSVFTDDTIAIPTVATPQELMLIDTYSKHGHDLAANTPLLNSVTKEQIQIQEEKLQQKKYSSELRKRAVLTSDPALLSSPHCEPFESVDVDAKTLYSPGYPGNYPNNTDCHVVLEAPPGYLLRLDFRDYFHIEPSEECKFDFIEIRDGGHGFSTLIGQFCGTEFPPMLTSRERRLWLRFHSDENIEYQGFVIVYEFIPRPTSSLYEDTSCRFELTGHEGWVNRTDIPADKVEANIMHNLPLDCMWVISVDPGWKIQIAFLQFQLERPNDCDSNFVDVFGEQTDIPNRIKNFCGSIADSVTSKENILHIRFYTEIAAIDSSFSILYTAFRDKPIGQSCEENEYDCEDATCISADLRCNGRVNCRFRWDEDECLTEVAGQSDHVIIVIVVFTLILSTIFIAFIISCCQKLIRDHKIIREHIRQSKESKLDELGRHSTKWTDKHQIHMRDLECISVKYPPPPISPITRKKVRNGSESDGGDGHGMMAPDHRYGFQDHLMQPIKRPSPHPDLSASRSEIKTSIANLQKANEMDRYNQLKQYPPSIQDSDASGAMCDMACQTRESLFQPVFNNNSQTPTTVGGQQPRFSTFGYDQGSSGTKREAGCDEGSSSIGSGTLSSLNNDGMEKAQQPSHHHRHCQQHQDRGKSLPRRNQNTSQGNSSNKDRVVHEGKDDHYSEVRKSAPDVIVMTSR